jgi:hypothetical protein
MSWYHSTNAAVRSKGGCGCGVRGHETLPGAWCWGAWGRAATRDRGVFVLVGWSRVRSRWGNRSRRARDRSTISSIGGHAQGARSWAEMASAVVSA